MAHALGQGTRYLIGPLELAPDTMLVDVAGRRVWLTRRELEVLVLIVVKVVVLRAERYDSLGAVAGLEAARVDVGGVDLADRSYALELMREGVDALLAQARQLGSAIIGPRRVVHAAGGY